MIQKDDDGIRQLWIRYKKDRDIQLRNDIIMHYSQLVNRVVNRIAPRYSDYIDIDDLVAYGILGLIDAIEKFDLDKGVKFETYATFRIRGAIIDQIREQDWIPRSLRNKAKDVEEAMEELEMKLGRQVEDEELAKHMGITIEELHRLLGQVHSFSLLSLDEQILEIIGGPSQLASDSNTPEDHALYEDLKRILSEFIDVLPQKEKMVINLYYYEELTLKEIGMIIGVSESRVSQLHSKALIKLKNMLKRVNVY
ncbi:MAG: FliA/WhiG family RNA polymerase sigma factor [Caldicoprobacterales bacterium]|jgi:RNA polymerase sigma factor for flagellar operon FliA|nr:FliA/WhiG family RNA polymerase sigma factor [Clostridiales bacterium]